MHAKERVDMLTTGIHVINVYSLVCIIYLCKIEFINEWSGIRPVAGLDPLLHHLMIMVEIWKRTLKDYTHLEKYRTFYFGPNQRTLIFFSKYNINILFT